MPGQIIGDRYEVVQQLGKKSGRWTLLARDLNQDMLVILKLLFIDDETRDDDLKLFRREADTLQSLKHPSTPRYLGSFEIELPFDGQALALVQSYIEGKPLQDYLEAGRSFTEQETKQISKEVLKILDHLHNQSPPIIHRDIKPRNILLTKRPNRPGFRVCLVDFGSVKALASGTTSVTLIGTQGYMSPEQMCGRTVQASDLYSLGVTLAAILTAREPGEIPMRGIQLKFEEVITLSDSFTAWLRKMIHPEVSQRFGTAREALDALKMLLTPQ